MTRQATEARSQGSLFAFVDLLFLLVAFLVLVLFFIKTEKSQAEVELETTQQRLATVEEEKSAMESVLQKVRPLVERFAMEERKEAEQRRALAAKEARRRKRSTFRLEYRIGKDGTVTYDGRSYAPRAFQVEVVERLRKQHWIAFRALAAPETPFGTVISFRRQLLRNQGEFDTYWDNLTSK